MKRNLKYFFSLTPGVVTVAGNLAGGHWVFANLFYSLVFLALVEWFVPEESSNEEGSASIIPDAILVMHLFMQILSLSVLFYNIRIGKITGIDLVGAALSTGVHSGSSSIVIAHEMIHRKDRLWQSMGKFLLFTAGNIYFFIEHLKVHHKWVGTVNDPATARYGENVYRFFIRSAKGQLTGAWKIEQQRTGNRFSLQNYVQRNALIQFVFVTALYFLAGIPLVAVYLLQVLVANFLLEYTNYIEHYGLTRSENERVREIHSWQSDKVISRFTLIDLSRHSDHHYYASKPYHTLKRYEESPVLPGGYASAIYLALIPPLWFKMVHPKIVALLGRPTA